MSKRRGGGLGRLVACCALATAAASLALGACSSDGEERQVPNLCLSLGATGGSGGATGNGCGARVVIGFYEDATCTPGTEVGERAYDTALDCFSWTAQGSNAGENSATRFQCYRDRLCYTQHANTLACDDGGFAQTDKQAKTGECLKEPDGSLYSRILCGTEPCPVAPPGFECPTSASQLGTPGVAACASAP